MTTKQQEELKGKRIQCPRCKCRKEQTAETKCQPTRGYDDEWECPMTYAKTDKEGYFIK